MSFCTFQPSDPWGPTRNPATADGFWDHPVCAGNSPRDASWRNLHVDQNNSEVLGVEPATCLFGSNSNYDLFNHWIGLGYNLQEPPQLMGV